MEKAVEKLREIKGVKNVKRQSSTLKINLFSRPVSGSESEEISGDLRKISQKIRHTLDEARNDGVFQGWEWIAKPEKQYQETKLGKRKVSDRKSKGHKPAFYRVSIREK